MKESERLHKKIILAINDAGKRRSDESGAEWHTAIAGLEIARQIALFREENHDNH